ncbi:MAG: type II secretion system F family protein [Nanoarchaeota archaeon]
MTIQMLRQNIEREKQIAGELVGLYGRYSEVYNSSASSNRNEQMKLLEQSMIALLQQIKILNNAIPHLLDGIEFYKTLYDSSKNEENKTKEIIGVNFIDESTKNPIKVAVKKKDEMDFLKHLAVHKFSIKNLWKKDSFEEKNIKNQKGMNDFEKAYIGASNKFFRNYADKLVEKKYFSKNKEDLRKIASPFIINSYVSVFLFSVFISIFAGILIAGLVLLMGLGFTTAFLVFLLTPIITGFLFYFYPSSTRKGLEKQINQELPFLVIYMAAISTSGIEPSKLFNILVVSKDYPSTGREIKKLTNYINFYGYDLVSALKAVSKNCPSERLALLFDGLATTITSGGALVDFLSKHSESLLFDYRLEREKYTHIAETFMNIYISVVIAAPMIMMMLFIMMSLIGFGDSGVSVGTIGILAILVISGLNMGFIIFLNSKQPKF